MNIPTNFKSALEKNQKINGIVNYTLSQYEEILKENKLYFFEEYTDHGISHIESVLHSSEKIITENTFKKVLNDTPDSIGIYILSIILHDIGMHLTPDGFYSLISGGNDEIRIAELDKKTWKELWNEFLDDARRFGDKEKTNIIGNSHWDFRVPDLENKDKLTGEDKKLIGEFIRLHHARIAHEIAINGFPKLNSNIPFASDLDLDLRDMCGLLARSHGVNVRSLFEYLINKFQDTWVKPYNLELIYLMIVLRIADYFQIDASRTPDIIVKLKTFNSPISQMEHFKHLDIKYVQPYNKDPETIIFHCEPRNSLIFLKLQELFSDIQSELDKSWAILGEVYGKESQEKQPAIYYRRVKSNIDDALEYSKKINYIPEKISFNVSNELPKLLIGPLYGNDPTFGVRELLQNAVDSCREREFLENGDYKGGVNISFFEEKNQLFFQIEDNGLGMPLNIIKNYFLEVGSSLRKSSIWKKIFSNEDGKSKVQRSGKFGIGVLAAFLIGDKLYLETKDSSSKYGLSFMTDLNSEQIEISKIEKEKVGTIIKIPIDKNILQLLLKSEFLFDKWYCHTSPNVLYIDETKTFDDLGYIDFAPGFNDVLSPNWNVLKSDSFNKIIWTYDPFFWDSEKGNLTCNGIVIPNAFDDDEDYYDRSLSRWVHKIKLPYISVFDFNGILPLNLSRNNIDGILPFNDDLIKEIYNDVIAKLLNEAVVNPFRHNNISLKEKRVFNHPSIGDVDLIFTDKGFLLKTDYFIRKNSSKTLLKISPKQECLTVTISDIKESFVHIVKNEDMAMTGFQYHANLIYLKSGGKLFIEKSMYKKLFDDGYNRYPMTVRRNHTLQFQNDDSVVVNYNYGEGVFTLTNLANNIDSCNYILETKFIESLHRELNTSEAVFSEQLESLLEGNSVIPYEISERKVKFSKAFHYLDRYQKKYNILEKSS